MPKRKGITYKSSKLEEPKTEHRIGSPLAPRLLPLKQAAEFMGLGVWALRERIWDGLIPVVQFNNSDGTRRRKMYIDTHDIETFIQQNKRVIV